MRAPLRSLLAVVLGALAVSCGDQHLPTSPVRRASAGLTFDLLPGEPVLLVSQVYGGGGNSGATLKNDFIEIFNPGTAAQSVSGWSVQYASATGTSWQVTNLSGSIPPGGYQLIQEAAGAGGTTSLPTPDATGGINMSGTSGKVALSSGTAALSGACPASGIVDMVSFGTGASNCGHGTTATLSNTTAALRGSNGCTWSNTATSLATDFTAGPPTPRNSASPATSCGAPAPVPASVTVAPDSTDVQSGLTTPFTATVKDASNATIAAPVTWSSSDLTIATIDATGVATGVAGGTVTITATASNGVHGTARLRVVTPPPPPPPADVVISQIYGGGGNSGATYKNDYVELFNHGTTPANIGGWMIQYVSAAGTFGTTGIVTIPAGATVAPSAHYLVQLAAGAGASPPLPTPDADLGTINMSNTAGKVLLLQPGTTVNGQVCPAGPGVVDHVGYGTGSNCGATWGGTTANVSNTLAVFRKDDGCINTQTVSADFTVLTPNPRNGASPARPCTQPARSQSSVQVAINEIMSDPANAENASWGQWFEVTNYGASPVDLFGWTIVSDGTSQPDHVINQHVMVPAGGFAVLGRGDDPLRNGGITLDYNYFTGGATTIWLDASDFLMLVDGAGARVDSVKWSSVPRGVTKALVAATAPHADADGPAWAYSTTSFGDGDYGTPGAANTGLASTPPVVSGNSILMSGRLASDAPLPVGREAQLFATEVTPAGDTIHDATFTWSSLTPDIASVDNRGVIHANAAGTARFHVVANDGATHNHTLTMFVATASATAQYGNNEEFGAPTAGDGFADFIIRRREYTTSFNGSRGIPNWVAYDLNGTEIQAGQDRCNCFTFDPALDTTVFRHYTTADYTGAGGFAGYGIDRGHMARSFDRTAGTLDNANTFLFSNVVPQASDLNQGPWALLEDSLGALATAANREVYIYVGPAGTIGTVKNEGVITIPAYTWKFALVLPRGAGLASIHNWNDVQDVIAVVMPNQPGVRNVDWRTSYKVTIDSIEHLTGYHFLSVLPDRVARALKSGTKPPIAAVSGPFAGAEASAVAMSGAGSFDPNGTVTSWAWDFGDGQTGSGASVSHSYARPGTYAVQLVVTDNDGLVDTAATTATVSDVAPVVASFAGASLIAGETYAAGGSFTDPGDETWAATADYGDGSGAGSLGLSGKTFALSHTFTAAGTFTVTVTVNDGFLSGSGTATVSVQSASQAVAALAALVTDQNSLGSKLQEAQASLDRGNNTAAANQLNAFENEIDAMVRSHRMTADRAAALKAAANRILAVITGQATE